RRGLARGRQDAREVGRCRDAHAGAQPLGRALLAVYEDHLPVLPQPHLVRMRGLVGALPTPAKLDVIRPERALASIPTRLAVAPRTVHSQVVAAERVSALAMRLTRVPGAHASAAKSVLALR